MYKRSTGSLSEQDVYGPPDLIETMSVPTSLAEALDFSASGKECIVRLTADIAFGSGMVCTLD